MDVQRITGAARLVGGKLRQATGDAGHGAARRAEDAYDEALDFGSRAMRDMRGRASHLADDALETGQELYARGVSTLARQAHERPLVLVAAAMLTGAALAWMLRGRPTRR